jgi:hypothetical protein
MSVVSPSVQAKGVDHRPLLTAIAVGVIGVVVVVAVTLSGNHHRRTIYAGSHDDSVLTGTIARPAVQTQGIAVRVLLPRGSVLATVTGPETPGQGLPFQQTYDTSTWTVRFTDATTDVPLALSDFDTLDHGGVVDHPQVVPDTPAPPAVLRAGRSVTFQLRDTMAVGEGLLRYAPNGNNIEAKWDFEIEND